MVLPATSYEAQAWFGSLCGILHRPHANQLDHLFRRTPGDRSKRSRYIVHLEKHRQPNRVGDEVQGVQPNDQEDRGDQVGGWEIGVEVDEAGQGELFEG